MVYKNETFDQERALYGARDVILENCAFEGEADGESALKESEGVLARDTRFSLRYPLWHTVGVRLEGCLMTEGCRAPLWYAEHVTLKDCRICGVKAIRECRDVSLLSVDAVSAELGWRSRDITVVGGSLSGEYAFFESRGIKIDGLSFEGKYSFQYVQGAFIKNAALKTKDAFWHAKGVTVTDSVIEGEYLGWYAEDIRFVRCTIRGTQPLCYARGVILEDCVMENADLAFEKSEVNGNVLGKIDSIKALGAGTLVCEGCTEILPEDDGSLGLGTVTVREGTEQ